jgi:hypothetical protein
MIIEAPSTFYFVHQRLGLEYLLFDLRQSFLESGVSLAGAGISG